MRSKGWSRLTPERLAVLGTAAFGYRWKTDLARALDVNGCVVDWWACGELRVSDKSEALIIALCVGRARANLSDALKVRREVERLRKGHIARPPTQPKTPPTDAQRKAWRDRYRRKHPLPHGNRKVLFPRKKPHTKRLPTAKQLAYWRSEAIREHGRKGLAVVAERRRSSSADAPVEDKAVVAQNASLRASPASPGHSDKSSQPEGGPLAYASEMCGSPGDSAQKTVDPNPSADAPVEDKT